MPPYQQILLPLSPGSDNEDFKRSPPSLGVPAVKSPPSLGVPAIKSPPSLKGSRKNNNNGLLIEDFGQQVILDGLLSLPQESSTDETEPYMSIPRTKIPDEFEWIRHTSTPQERRELIRWAVAAARKAEEEADPDECRRLLDWSGFVYDTIAEGPQVYTGYLEDWTHSTSNNQAPGEHKRLTWAHSTAGTAAPDEHKRWSLQEEVTNLFELAMIRVQTEIKKNPKLSYPGERDPGITQEHRIYNYQGEPGVYQCQNALWLWAEIETCLTPSQSDEGPKYVGEKINEKFPESDMIEERVSINELGFVTIKLSGKWIAKSISKMLKDGIDTWAPKLPVERVSVAYPSFDEEVPVDMLRLLPIGCTLTRILEYSKVDVTIVPKSFERDGILDPELLNRWFPCEEREGEVATKLENASKYIFALWYGLRKEKSDWMVSVTPLRQQVDIGSCLAAAKLEGWISSDRHRFPKASYAGYQTCITDQNLFGAQRHCMTVAEGVAARLLGYSAGAYLECVFRYTSLMNHRLTVCTFDIEMFSEQGNTFFYLLNTLARIRRITNDYCKDIGELKKSSELILEKDERWEKGEERVLGFHLLKFTEALQESCLCVLPHILCEYLYDLCKIFNGYLFSVRKDGSFVEKTTLLLYEATAVVMEKCFHLLGITPAETSSLFGSSMKQLLSGSLFFGVERLIDLKDVRDPTAYSRFEMVSFRARPRVRRWYAEKGELFGLISVSDKSMQSRSRFFEPDIAHVPLFNHEWRNPINMCNCGLIYLGNPGSGQPVSFSNFIEIHAEIFIRNEKECYQLCDQKKEIDLKKFWDTKEDGVCGQLFVVTKRGTIEMNYILMKDAIDTSLTVKFTTKSDTPRLVRGYIQAYYGDEFLYTCKSGSICKEAYMVLLFRAAPSFELKAGNIPLIRSCLAVPTKGRLIIKAYLVDVKSNKVIVNGTAKLKPVCWGPSRYVITGFEDCSLDVGVCWDYRS